MRFYRDYYTLTASLLRSDTKPKAYLRKKLSGYLTSQAVIATLVGNQKSNTKVLLWPDLEGLNFYFRKVKIISVGDHFGPARYRDLFKELEKGNCLPYLTPLDVSAVIIQPYRGERWWPRFYDQFQLQLKNHGFREYRTWENNVVVFLRSDIAPSRELTPLAQ